MNTATLTESFCKENSSITHTTIDNKQLHNLKCLNTLTPNFNYKNEVGEFILAKTCIVL
jgi:hypothetical protein